MALYHPFVLVAEFPDNRGLRVGAGVVLMLFSSICVALMHERHWASCIGDPGVRLAARLARNTHLEVGTEYIARKNTRTRTERRPFWKKGVPRQGRMATSILQLA
jgi:hypothetical protein